MQRQDMSLAELIDLFKNEPMQFAPGAAVALQQLGVHPARGHHREGERARSTPTSCSERIFTPLGMTDTRYDVTDEVIPRRAAGYARTGDRIVNAQYLSMTQPYAAGALISTVDDLAKWDAALAAGRVVQRGLAREDRSRPTSWPAETRPGTGTAGDRPVRGPGGPGARRGHPRVPFLRAPDPVGGRVRRRAVEPRRAPSPTPASSRARPRPSPSGSRWSNPAAIALTPEQLDAYVGRYVTAAGTRLRRDPRGHAAVRAAGGRRARPEVFLVGQRRLLREGRVHAVHVSSATPPARTRGS